MASGMAESVPLDRGRAEVGVAPVLDDDEAGIPRDPSGPPNAGHVEPEGHHDRAVAHDEHLVVRPGASHPVERGAGTGSHLEQRLAAAGGRQSQ